MLRLTLVPLRDCAELVKQVFAAPIQSLWPEFMRQDPTADLYFATPYFESYLDTAFAVVDPARPQEALGRAFAVPFAREGVAGRDELPETGWDGVIRWAHEDRALGRTTDTVSALEITLIPSHRGGGASLAVLDAMRARVAGLGYRRMVAPVRPTAKHLEALTPMSEYAARTDAAGLPADPWLRVHARAGGKIEKIAPTSMVIPGSLANWRRWTGLPFNVSGPMIIPHALAPVHVSVEQDHAIYVEANVWVRHKLPGVD